MTIKQINETIEVGSSLKLISQAYTEIASSRLKKIRTQVEKNRYFLQDLTQVYQIVKQVANAKGILPQKNNKTLSILVTSNYHFYGNINTNLINFYLKQAKSGNHLVIGKTGVEFLRTSKANIQYDTVMMKKDFPESEELEAIATKTKNYSQIVVFYPQMKSVLVQDPTAADITLTSKSKEAAIPFIFEPEINKILDFFEHQVTKLLLEQTFLESELARSAARLVSMDNAQANADKFIMEQKRLFVTAKRTITNTRLLETVNAMIGERGKKYAQ